MKFIKLITENNQHIWNQYRDFDTIFKEAGAPFPPKKHLEHIDKNFGEIIIAVSSDEETILGWIGIIPNEKELYAQLEGIEVHSDFRIEGIGTRLIFRAQEWLSDMGINEFRFSTTPLFAANTSLYLNKFASDYKWNNKTSLSSGNILWPVVDCVMNWSEKQPHVKVNYEKGLEKLSVLNWQNLKPSLNSSKLKEHNKYKIAGFPYLSLPIILKEFKSGNTSVSEIPYDMFNTLDEENYIIKTMVKENSMFYYIFEKNE